MDFLYTKIPLARRTIKWAPQLPGLAGIKGQRGKEIIMLDWLKTILGETYTEEIDKKVSAEIGKSFVSKADFNTVNEAKKTLETTVSDRDKQIDDLKKVDPSALQAEITRLQGENAQKDTDYKKQLDDFAYDSAAAVYAGGIKFTSDLARKAYLAELKTANLKLDSGKLMGADDFTKTMREQNPTAFAAEPKGGSGFANLKSPGTPDTTNNTFMNNLIRGKEE